MVKLPPYIQNPGIHISPLGIISKKNKPGKWRLIVDLSSPSVNDGISEQLSSLSFVISRPSFHFDLENRKWDIPDKSRHQEGLQNGAGPSPRLSLVGCLLGKVNLHRPGIAIQITLSAKNIFGSYICTTGVLQRTLHYLDDFIVVSQDQASAGADKQALISLWDCLGVPMEISSWRGLLKP